MRLLQNWRPRSARDDKGHSSDLSSPIVTTMGFVEIEALPFAGTSHIAIASLQKPHMRKKIVSTYFRALICASAFLFHCEAKASEVMVTEANNGKTICLEVSDTVSLNLDGNPTTGYMWEISSIDRDFLQVVEQSYKSSSDLIGAGGMFTFTFRAAAKGSTNLCLVYARPWEKTSPPAKTFEVTVVIDSPN